MVKHVSGGDEEDDRGRQDLQVQRAERGGGDGLGDLPLGALLGVVADEVDEVVGDARRAAAAAGDLAGAAVVDRGDVRDR